MLAVLIVLWSLFGPEKKTDVLNLDSRGTTIVAFGDSLVQGVGSTSGNDFVSLLSGAIGRPIVNLGKSGDTTALALARIDTIFEHDPRIVIVLLGGNDFLRRIPMDTTFENLSIIVKAIQARGAAVLVLGVRGGLLYDSYRARFASFAKEHRTAFVPNVLDGLVGDVRLMSDSIHPNNVGHEMIANKVLPVLKGMLD